MPERRSEIFEAKTWTEVFGTWAFFVGALLAILAGLIPAWQGAFWVTWVLAILGLIVGLFNITLKETHEFLLSTAVLLIAGTVAALPELGVTLGQILRNIVAFVWPAALLVSLKAIIALASKR